MALTVLARNITTYTNQSMHGVETVWNITDAHTWNDMFWNSSHGHAHHVTIIEEYFCVVILILGSLGNLSLFCTMLNRCKELGSFETLLCSLPMADFVASIFIPIEFLSKTKDFEFYITEYNSCLSFSFLSSTRMSVASFTLVALSIDRYIYVKRPLRYQPSTITLLLVIDITWLLGCLVGFMFHVGNVTAYSCNEDDTYTLVFATNGLLKLNTTTCIIQIVSPLLLITLIQFLIYNERRWKLNHSLLPFDKEMNRLLSTLVKVFFLCATPVNLFYILITIKLTKPNNYTVRLAYHLLLLLEAARLCVNPIIFLKLYKPFRVQVGEFMYTILNLFNSETRKQLMTSDSFEERVETAV